MYVIGNSYHIHKGASISDVLIQIRLCLLNLKDFSSDIIYAMSHSLTSLLFAVNKFITGIFTWIFVPLHKCVLKT